MWKEDPRWQQAHYKVVIYAIGIFALLIPPVSLFSGDWEITRTYFLILGILAAAVCLYDALVWVAVRVVLFVISLCKRLLHRGR